MRTVDIAQTFIRYARTEAAAPLGIEYQVASALDLPFDDEQFDFATAFMSFQDMPQQEAGFREAFRVLKPGGFLQFSITHPCFQTPKWNWILDEGGRRTAMIVGDYFDQAACRTDEWTFGAAPPEVHSRYPKFRIAYFDHTLSEWLNMLLRAGFNSKPLPNQRPATKSCSSTQTCTTRGSLPTF